MNRYVNTKTKEVVVMKSHEPVINNAKGEWKIEAPKPTIVVPSNVIPKLETKPLPPSTKA